MAKAVLEEAACSGCLVARLRLGIKLNGPHEKQDETA